MKTERILPKIRFCELKRQIDSQTVEIGHTRTRYEQSRREQALLHKEVADRERAIRDTRIWSIQKLEDLKRDQDFRLEEFSLRKLVENHFKDVESVRSGQLFHVPSEQTLFPLPREPRGLLSRDYKLLPNFWDTHGKSRNVFGWSTCEYFDNLFKNAQFKGFLYYGKYSGANKYGETRNKVVIEITTNLEPKGLKIPNSLKTPSTGILTLLQKECISNKESRSLMFHTKC